MNMIWGSPDKEGWPDAETAAAFSPETGNNDMSENRQKQPNGKPRADGSEFDFGDLNEAGGTAGPAAAEIEAKAREQERAERTEAETSLRLMAEAQEAVLAALRETGRTPNPERLDALAAGEPVELKELKAEGVDAEAERRENANRVYLAKLKDADGREFTAVYKPKKGEAHYYEEQAAESGQTGLRPERRHRKEWLGYQLDTIFDVGSSPAATVREFQAPAGEPDAVGGYGAVVEYLNGRPALMTEGWRQKADAGELARVADLHYLVGETDGHDGQIIIGDDRRLRAFDRGEAFLDSNDFKFKSAAMEEARDRGLNAHPDVLAAARRFLASDRLQQAAARAFEAAFGPENGRRRYDLMFARAKTYAAGGGIPYTELERTGRLQKIGDNRHE